MDNISRYENDRASNKDKINQVLVQHFLEIQKKQAECRRLYDQAMKMALESGHIYCSDPDVLQKVLLDLWENVDKYDPSKSSPLYFISKKTNWRRLDRDRAKKPHISLDQTIGNDGACSLTLADTIPSPPQDKQEYEAVKKHIIEDPQGKYTKAHVKDRPEANFRAIALLRLEEVQWEAMSALWNIPVPTLSCYFRRCLKKFASEFKQFEHLLS